MGKIKKKPAGKILPVKVNQGGIQKKKKTKKPFTKINDDEKLKDVLFNQIKVKRVPKPAPSKKTVLLKKGNKPVELSKATAEIPSNSEEVARKKSKHEKKLASPAIKTKTRPVTDTQTSKSNGIDKKKKKNRKQDPESSDEDEDKYKNMSVAEFMNTVAKEMDGSEEEQDESDDSDDDEKEVPDLEESDDSHDDEKEIPDLEESDSEGTDQEGAEKEEEEGDDSELEEQSGDEVEAHKKSLAKLKETDPDFFKFLEEEDEFDLLKFGSSDEEQDNEKDDDEDDEDDNDVHKATTELEVASDESDFEAGEDEDKEQEEEEGGALKKVKDHGKITQNMLKAWETNIEIDKTNKTMAALVDAFHAALLTVSAEDDDVVASSYQVEGSAIFNGVIRLCVTHLGSAFLRFLGINEGSKLPHPPHKYKKFIKIKKMMQCYLTDLTKLLAGVTSANIQTVLLRHLHYVSSFLVSFPNVTKAILKRLIHIWGGADESVRVLAFFCILRITNAQRLKFLETVLKSMYITYVKNSKFVSVNNLASINFMRRSLVEMFALDVNVAYQLVFMYVRQLAIHLRNAITLKKKENIHSVYNWQFINSLKLWGNLLAVTAHKPQLHQLIYPFVQVAIGTIKLVPTTQYFPLRFHVVQILMELSRDTGIFIPVLPFLLEVLTSYDFNKKHQKVSMRPMQFTSVLRASKSQMLENGFKDAVIERVYALMLEYLALNSSSIAFPDLSLVCSVQLREFLKSCRNVNYKRKMKQIQEKIKQNSDFIEEERKKVTMNIKDFQLIEGWEAQLKAKGTPLATFFESWNKVHTLKKNKQATDNEKLGDYKLPTLKKRKFDKSRKKDDDGPLELFPSDSEEEEEVTVEGKRKRGKRGKGLKKRVDQSGPVQDTGEKDVIQDLDMDDW